MELLRHKASTKDIDLVVDEEDVLELAKAMRSIGLIVDERKRDGPIVQDTKDGIFVDLFGGQICGKMVLTKGMEARSHAIDISSKARLHAISKEDIFLLKSMTERDRDTDEMFTLYRDGIDGEVVLEECDLQDGDCIREDRRIYTAFLAEKLKEMERRHGIQITWKKKAIELAEAKMLDRTIYRLVESKRAMKQLDMAIAIDIPDMGDLPRRRLKAMVEAGYIIRGEDGSYIVARQAKRAE
ncbi:MAG: hypothetical protein WCK39_00725 [Methanomassiliicoccales archaeon]